MALLYADEDFSYPVVQRLRQLGHDLLTAHEAGQASQSITDAAVLAFATVASRAVLSLIGAILSDSTLKYHCTQGSLFALVTTIV